MDPHIYHSAQQLTPGEEFFMIWQTFMTYELYTRSQAGP